MPTNTKPPPRRRRGTQQKKVAKAVLHAAFHGWQDDGPAALAQRIDNLRNDVMFRHRFTEPEWLALDKMRDKMRANEKFARAVQEAKRVPLPR
jgi:hypothetical protein